MVGSDRAALVRIRNAYAAVKADAEALREALAPQIRELDDPAVWTSREAARVRRDLHAASIGVRNRSEQAQALIEHIDLTLQSTP